MPSLTKSEAGRLGGIASWEKSREVKLLASSRGGAEVVERYGRSHMLRLAYRIKQYGCAGGEIPPSRQDDRGRGKCPVCGKRVSVMSGNRTRRHVRADAPPALRVIKGVGSKSGPVESGREKGATI